MNYQNFKQKKKREETRGVIIGSCKISDYTQAGSTDSFYDAILLNLFNLTAHLHQWLNYHGTQCY